MHTRPFRDARGEVLAGSIATMETIEIGGVAQSVWFRGASTDRPALVLLHGGPGASESALFRHYVPGLERRFLVVYWEQRGTGRSYHRDLAAESLTIERLLADLDELVEIVRERFGKRRVVLLGHSWGTVLGVLYAERHPEKVAAYVGVAQIASAPEGFRVSHEFAIAEAVRRVDEDALEELREIGPRPRSVDDALALGRWVERFGGMFHGELSTGRLVWAALGTDEANLVDLVRFGLGNRFSLEALWDEWSTIDLASSHREFAVPIFFLLGRHDRHVPASLAADYFEHVRAPCKRLVWFEESAHDPPFEEPARFERVLAEEVLPIVEHGCADHHA